MKKAYFYPISAYIDASIYTRSFMDCMATYYEILNRSTPSKWGILDLPKYIRNIDTIFLNWIEDLPDKRGGFLQSVFFIVMMVYLRRMKVKVVWVLHNKGSHYRSNRFLKCTLFRGMMKRSDLIVTHSKEGIHFLKERGIDISRAVYSAHPLERRFLEMDVTPSIDLLIWGTIIPYKGVDSFLEYLHARNLGTRYRIQLAGKVKPDDYAAIIKSFCNDYIRLENRYIPENELMKYMGSSKAILFTYDGGSVLSSGALMDSLAYGLNVVAPNVGAFKDAGEDGLIYTYSGFEDLIDNMDNYLSPPVGQMERIEQFISENTWSRFAAKLDRWINNLN